MSQPATAKRKPSIIGIGLAGVGALAGIASIAVFPLASSILLIPAGPAIGAFIGARWGTKDASGQKQQKAPGTKIKNAIKGAMAGAVVSLLFPAAPLVYLGGAAGYKVGKTIGGIIGGAFGMLTGAGRQGSDMVAGVQEAAPAQSAAPTQAPVPAAAQNIFKSNLRQHFPTGRTTLTGPQAQPQLPKPPQPGLPPPAA